MWLFLDEGFISAVAYNPKEDSNERSKRQVKSWGRKPILARSRLRDDLEQIRPFWSKLRIEKDDTADYEFRAVIPRGRWVEFVAHKAAEIDYESHFKEVAQKRSPGGSVEGLARHSAYMKIWSAMAALQPDAPYSGSSWYSKYSSGTYKSGVSSYEGTFCENTKQFTDDGKTYRQWCVLKKKHTGDCDWGKANPITVYPKTATAEPVKFSGDKVQTHHYDSTNPLGMPDTVEDMCKELLSKVPDNITVDPATPYATYDLWCRAEEEELDRPLNADELLVILRELAYDYCTVNEARDKYLEAIDQFSVVSDEDVIGATLTSYEEEVEPHVLYKVDSAPVL